MTRGGIVLSYKLADPTGTVDDGALAIDYHRLGVQADELGTKRGDLGRFAAHLGIRAQFIAFSTRIEDRLTPLFGV